MIVILVFLELFATGCTGSEEKGTPDKNHPGSSCGQNQSARLRGQSLYSECLEKHDNNIDLR